MQLALVDKWPVLSRSWEEQRQGGELPTLGKGWSMVQSTEAKSFRDLLEEVRSGSQDAAWELVDTYGPHVHRYVRRVMHRDLRSKFDSLDFVQIMWASLFRQPGRLTSFDQPEQLIAHLITLAKNKVIDELRRRTVTARYDMGREKQLPGDDDADGDVRQPPPTPSAVAIAKERWVHLLSNQNATVQSVVTMRLRGETFDEIADKLQIHERTARKAIARLTGDEENAL
jgi:RNA polymerase sigma factor (sigma-70 family)